MNESKLKMQLVNKVEHVCVGAQVARHEHRPGNKVGWPDISVTWRKQTTWLEVKYANPDFKVSALQKIRCVVLAREGFCWFVIYREKTLASERQTLIVHPDHITGPWVELTVEGFNHAAVANFLRDRHDRKQ